MNLAHHKIDQYDAALWACIDRAQAARDAGNIDLSRRCDRAARVAERHKDAWIARAMAEDDDRRERALEREQLWKEAVHDD